MDTFPRGSKLTNELMDRVMAAVRPSPLLRQKLYQVNFHTTLSGQAMVRSWAPHTKTAQLLLCALCSDTGANPI